MYRLYVMDGNHNMVPVLPHTEDEKLIDDHMIECVNKRVLAWKVFINYNLKENEEI